MLANGFSLECEWQQVSRTFVGILADLNNAVVWMVSTRRLISKSSSPCTNPFVNVPGAPITIGITVTFIIIIINNNHNTVVIGNIVFSHKFLFRL